MRHRLRQELIVAVTSWRRLTRQECLPGQYEPQCPLTVVISYMICCVNRAQVPQVYLPGTYPDATNLLLVLISDILVSRIEAGRMESILNVSG
jgi:hypothetical protein